MLVFVVLSKVICGPFYAVCFYFFSVETMFRNFTILYLSIFSSICQVLGGPFQSGNSYIQILGYPIVFWDFLTYFSLSLPLPGPAAPNSYYSDVHPPWTATLCFPFFLCFLSFIFSLPGKIYLPVFQQSSNCHLYPVVHIFFFFK